MGAGATRQRAVENSPSCLRGEGGGSTASPRSGRYFSSKQFSSRIVALERVGSAPRPFESRRAVQARRPQPVPRARVRPVAAGAGAIGPSDAARQSSPAPHARARRRAAPGRRTRRSQRAVRVLGLRRSRARSHVDRNARLRIRLGLPLARRAGGLDWIASASPIRFAPPTNSTGAASRAGSRFDRAT